MVSFFEPPPGRRAVARQTPDAGGNTQVTGILIVAAPALDGASASERRASAVGHLPHCSLLASAVADRQCERHWLSELTVLSREARRAFKRVVLTGATR